MSSKKTFCSSTSTVTPHDRILVSTGTSLLSQLGLRTPFLPRCSLDGEGIATRSVIFLFLLLSLVWEASAGADVGTEACQDEAGKMVGTATLLLLRRWSARAAAAELGREGEGGAAAELGRGGEGGAGAALGRGGAGGAAAKT